MVSGHSAGGHLAACLMATDWRSFDPALPENLVKAAYTISGLFDLGPLVKTSVNGALELDEAAAGRQVRRSGNACAGHVSTPWSVQMKAPSIFGRAG